MCHHAHWSSSLGMLGVPPWDNWSRGSPNVGHHAPLALLLDSPLLGKTRDSPTSTRCDFQGDLVAMGVPPSFWSQFPLLGMNRARPLALLFFVVSLGHFFFLGDLSLWLTKFRPKLFLLRKPHHGRICVLFKLDKGWLTFSKLKKVLCTLFELHAYMISCRLP